MYDKVIRSPRLVHFCGDVEADQSSLHSEHSLQSLSRFHTYSSYSQQIKKWHPQCEWIRDSINRELGIRYDSCLLNYYKEANGPLNSVATVSLGSTHRFYLQNNSTKEIIKVELNNMDLVISACNAP